MMGTPAYMPPEQVLGKEVDGRADLYSVGVVFYRLLTGALPFKADTAIGMVQKQISETPTPLNFSARICPTGARRSLERALSKSPADRFQTAEEFRKELLAQIGAAATEHTGVFAAAHGATPQSLTGARRILPTPRAGRLPAVPAAAAAAVPAAKAPAAQKPNPQTEGRRPSSCSDGTSRWPAPCSPSWAVGVAVLAMLRGDAEPAPAPARLPAAAAVSPDSLRRSRRTPQQPRSR